MLYLIKNSLVLSFLERDYMVDSIYISDFINICKVMIVKRNRNNFIKVNVIFGQSKKQMFVRFKNIFTIFENIRQREL